MKASIKRILLPAAIAAILVFDMFGIAFIVRYVITFYQTPVCSERFPNPSGYRYIDNLNTVTMERLNSGDLCAAIEDADANGKTECAVTWIDEGAGIALVDVSGDRDCRSSASNYVFSAWSYAKIIVRGHTVSVAHYQEAVEYPARSGKYLDGLNLTDEEQNIISFFLADRNIAL